MNLLPSGCGSLDDACVDDCVGVDDDVGSVLIGPGLGVGSSFGSILIFFSGTGDGSSDDSDFRLDEKSSDEDEESDTDEDVSRVWRTFLNTPIIYYWSVRTNLHSLKFILFLQRSSGDDSSTGGDSDENEEKDKEVSDYDIHAEAKVLQQVTILHLH